MLFYISHNQAFIYVNDCVNSSVNYRFILAPLQINKQL